MSMDSPAANAAFAKQIGVKFPLLSDPDGQIERQYGVLIKKANIKGVKYALARRTSFVIDKRGIIRHVEISSTALNPNNAVTFCLTMKHRAAK